jgi:hypothetical protein
MPFRTHSFYSTNVSPGTEAWATGVIVVYLNQIQAVRVAEEDHKESGLLPDGLRDEEVFLAQLHRRSRLLNQAPQFSLSPPSLPPLLPRLLRCSLPTLSPFLQTLLPPTFSVPSFAPTVPALTKSSGIEAVYLIEMA